MINNKEFSSTTPQGVTFIGITNPSLYEGFDPKLAASDLIEYAGLIPQLMCNGEEGKTFKENIDDNYIYGHQWGTRATIDDKYMYNYPEDEPLAPILMIVNPRTEEQALIYPYALVAVQDGDEWLTTRLD